jgi:hypothetical protein
MTYTSYKQPLSPFGDQETPAKKKLNELSVSRVEEFSEE